LSFTITLLVISVDLGRQALASTPPLESRRVNFHADVPVVAMIGRKTRRVPVIEEFDRLRLGISGDVV